VPVDFAVATPTFLDLTFVGLEGLPELGEERFAGELLRSPGGGAIIAVGAARLGMSTALASPLGDDPPGVFLRGELAREGIVVIDRRSRSTPTTVVLPVAGERAMITVDRGYRCTPAEVAALEPRAVAASLDQLRCVPGNIPAYITCGDDDARAFARRPPAELSDVHAFFVSRREASALTGLDDASVALEQLADTIETVVVTCGPRGAIAISKGQRYEVPAIDTGRPVVDATGARDLLVAAYAWAELRGADAELSLRWSMVYAGLSVTTPTAVGGAVTEERLLEEGTRLGLPAPGG
jgi:sugar/nucleoside kinase (ribokinase family)